MPVNPDKPRKTDDKTPEELLKELEYLRAENDYLKTLQGILLEKKRLESLKKQRR
jgi:hypothetical protein